MKSHIEFMQKDKQSDGAILNIVTTVVFIRVHEAIKILLIYLRSRLPITLFGEG